MQPEPTLSMWTKKSPKADEKSSGGKVQCAGYSLFERGDKFQKGAGKEYSLPETRGRNEMFPEKTGRGGPTARPLPERKGELGTQKGSLRKVGHGILTRGLQGKGRGRSKNGYRARW